MNVRVSWRTVALAAACMFLASGAKAACGSPGRRAGFVIGSLQLPAAVMSLSHATVPGGDQAAANPSIVGMWAGTLYLGSGPVLYDQQFDTWFADGNEVALDNAVPPFLGNVCVGVWKKVGPKTYKLRHMTWNWDVTGVTLAGTFLLIETVTLSQDGNSYSGSYVADSFDTNGNIIPELHAEGNVAATRITVD